MAKRADGTYDLRELILKVLPEAKVYYCKDRESLTHLYNKKRIFFVSGGEILQGAIGILLSMVKDAIVETLACFQMLSKHLENEKQLAEITSRLGQIEQILRDRFLVSPIAGTVFELEAGTGFSDALPPDELNP